MSTSPHEIPSPSVLAVPSDRRTAPRLRPSAVLPVRVGRGEGVVCDLAIGGVRIQHSGAQRRGGHTRVVISWEQQQLSLDCEVLSTRVADLGSATSPPLYESRFRFRGMDEADLQTLTRLVASLRTRDLRKLVANLRGWDDEPQENLPTAATFIRMTRDGNEWQKKVTRASEQPAEGFVLPGGTELKEIELMCQTWERLDESGRELLRRMAAAAVEAA